MKVSTRNFSGSLEEFLGESSLKELLSKFGVLGQPKSLVGYS